MRSMHGKLQRKKQRGDERSVSRIMNRTANRTVNNDGSRYYRAHDRDVLELQRKIGNEAVTHLLQTGELQAKLDVGPPGDIYEQEADRMAEHVMAMSEPRVMRKEPQGTPPDVEDDTGAGTNATSAPTITFSAGVNQDAVSQHSLDIIGGILTAAGEDSAEISSTTRTPAAQASAMYTNIVSQGVAAQRQLYGSYGDQVIDTYEESLAAGRTAQQIRDDMEAKIIELGPSNVSKHCAEPDELQVIDIRPSTIDNDDAFVSAVNDAITAGTVSRFFQPPADPAYHLEIPQ